MSRVTASGDPPARLLVKDEMGRGLENDRDAVHSSGEINDAADAHKLQLFHTDKEHIGDQAQQKNSGSKYNAITGSAINLGDAEKDDADET